MSSDDHSLIPTKRTELARRDELHNPILAKMARDLLVKAKAQLATADAVVHFKCPNLEGAIRKALDKPEGTITRKDLASLETFDERDKEITDLSGLEYATNLTVLTLESNQITDVTPLSGLTKLTTLWLAENEITDVTPLSGLTKLTKLELESNQITDVTPLSGLTKLTELWLYDNEITDDQKHQLRLALPNCDIKFE